MVKLKTILDTRRPKSDGTFAIMFRITNHKQVNYLSFGVSATQVQWDEKSGLMSKLHPNANSINASLSKRFYEIQKAILALDNDETFSIDALKEMLIPKIHQTVIPTTFAEFSQQVINEFIQVRRTGNGLVYLTAVNRLIRYCDNPKLKFSDIDFTLLNGFKNKLLLDGIKKNTIVNYFRSIRALYNKAIKAKHVSRDLYPFHDISIKTEKTAKRAININELSKIYNHQKQIMSQEWHASNYFFLSFTLRGISFTDMAYLTLKDIHKGHLIYRRRKTQKLYNIKLHPLALQIIGHYKDNPSGYLIPVFPKGIEEDGVQAKKITRQWIKTTNKYLNRIAYKCNINDHITTYVTRHTWATTAKKLGYANEIIAEAMGHEYGNKITNIYLDDFDQKLLDEMNDKVILSAIPCLLQVTNAGKYAQLQVFNRFKFKGQALNFAY